MWGGGGSAARVPWKGIKFSVPQEKYFLFSKVASVSNCSTTVYDI